jgi:hypothetical protein
MTKKLAFALIALLVFSFAVTAFSKAGKTETTDLPVTAVASMVAAEEPVSAVVSPSDKLMSLYTTLSLDELKMNKTAFELALKGYLKLLESGKVKNDLLTIVDFSQPSTSKRMYIIDMQEGKLLKHTHVAHGRNTGALMAKNFSNIPESYQSSLGFYLTSETYHGKHGLSLRLDGMEKKINDNARARAIVVHGADYANESFYKSTGYLGRSFGCPAVPTKDAKVVINTIKNGSVMFLYSPDKNYVKLSSFAS